MSEPMNAANRAKRWRTNAAARKRGSADTAALQRDGSQQREVRAIAPIDAALFSIADARAHLGGIGRSSIYRLVGQGKLEAVHVGRRAMISGRSVRALAGLEG